MIAEFLMEIGYIFRNSGKGTRVVGGADPNYSTEDLSWLNFINKNVMIKTKKGNLLYKVKKIDVFPSIAGTLNIGITLSDDMNFDFLDIGDKVYKIADTDNIE